MIKTNSKIGASKPKKQSLISNLIHRVDDKSVAVKKHKTGIMIYWEKNTERFLLANKEVLDILSYEEIEQLMEGNELSKDYTINMFKLIQNSPERINQLNQVKKSITVSNYKEFDKKTNTDNIDFSEKPNKPVSKIKRKRI